MAAFQFSLYNISLAIVLCYTLAGWLVPLGIKIGYGRLKNSTLSLELPPKLAWFLFEVPNLIWAVYFILIRGDQLSLGYGHFIVHYINRCIIYPLSLKTTNKVPLEIAAAAASFTFANGYLQGLSNQKMNQSSEHNKLLLVLGIVLFFLGLFINIKSDQILQSAKEKSGGKKKEDEQVKSKHNYVVINEFLFKYVANPNYFGEIIEWLGYFLICQNIQSFLFFFSTFNILTAAAIPRSQWNKQNIEGYPKSRKAVIPYIL